MKLNFKKSGEGEVLIILHGLFGSADNWQTLAKYFAEKFTVYIVDLRNHGHSPHSDEMNYDVMAEDVLELMDDEKIERAIVLGHSMGAKTAMTFAQRFPDRISKLIVADMGTKKYPPHHQLIFEALLSADLDQLKTRREVENHLKAYIQDPSVLQFLLKNLFWSDREKLEWRFNLHVLFREIEEILAAIPTQKVNVPALFIRGEKSNYILDEDFESIRNQFTNSEIKTIEGAGHWIHAEAPQVFYKIVMDFIA